MSDNTPLTDIDALAKLKEQLSADYASKDMVLNTLANMKYNEPHLEDDIDTVMEYIQKKRKKIYAITYTSLMYGSNEPFTITEVEQTAQRALNTISRWIEDIKETEQTGLSEDEYSFFLENDSKEFKFEDSGNYYQISVKAHNIDID